MSSIYWYSMDYDSQGTMSTKTTSSMLTKYVDPWDLENYAYMKKRLNVPEPSGSPAPSALGETDASFFYTEFENPENNDGFYKTMNDRSDNYFYHDELNYRNDMQNHYHQPYSERDEIYGILPDYSDMEDPDIVDTVFMPDNSHLYETEAKYTMTVPSSINYRPVSCYPSDLYNSIQKTELCYATTETIPIYDDRTPKKFSLTNYGHLKIDYSVSWNSLDMIIKK